MSIKENDEIYYSLSEIKSAFKKADSTLNFTGLVKQLKNVYATNKKLIISLDEYKNLSTEEKENGRFLIKEFINLSTEELIELKNYLENKKGD